MSAWNYGPAAPNKANLAGWMAGTAWSAASATVRRAKQSQLAEAEWTLTTFQKGSYDERGKPRPVKNKANLGGSMAGTRRSSARATVRRDKQNQLRQRDFSATAFGLRSK